MISRHDGRCVSMRADVTDRLGGTCAAQSLSAPLLLLPTLTHLRVRVLWCGAHSWGDVSGCTLGMKQPHAPRLLVDAKGYVAPCMYGGELARGGGRDSGGCMDACASPGCRWWIGGRVVCERFDG